MRVSPTYFASFLVLFLSISTHAGAQASLLLEQPYGFFGAVNPTGHEAIYIEHVCAETPVKLRRCNPDENGVVISRYSALDHYDWAAVPLIPYLYAVEEAADVPQHVDHATVDKLRDQYRERHLMSLGKDLHGANFFHGGWTELVGTSYERRVYAFRFATTEEQDDRVIALFNQKANKSHFDLFYNNCADFARKVLDIYFPHEFRRNIFPDLGMTTPKQITYKLEKYAHKHPELEFKIFEIPQVPGYRRHSEKNHGVAESMIARGYVIPIAILNPYLAGGIFVDYLVRGRYPLVPKDTEVTDADHMYLLTEMNHTEQDPMSYEVGVDALSYSKEKDLVSHE